MPMWRRKREEDEEMPGKPPERGYDWYSWRKPVVHAGER